MKSLRDHASKNHTLEAGIQDFIMDAVLKIRENNVPESIIAKSLKISEEKVKNIIEKHRNK